MKPVETVNPLLVRKYNQPLPRYTSYPTVPFWNDHLEEVVWATHFTQAFTAQNSAQGISLYVHLPFCESLCTYCGCNKKITTNHSVETEYLEALAEEWRLYLQLMPEPPLIRELHLGGGTPTFFHRNIYGSCWTPFCKRPACIRIMPLALKAILTIQLKRIYRCCTTWDSAGSAMACRITILPYNASSTAYNQ